MKRLMYRVFSSIFSTLLIINTAAAQQDQADAVPGFTHESVATRGGTQLGALLNSGAIGRGSPVVADIDGDPSNGLETAIGSGDGIVTVLRADGTELWSQPIPRLRCRRDARNDRILSTPAVGDLFGDGVPYVVVGYGGFISSNCGGGVIAFRGRDGRRRWNFNLRRFSRRQNFFAVRHAVFGAPALADVDGDGDLEVGFGSFDRNVYLLESNGRPRWYYLAGDTVFSSPAFANVDDDPDLEMIIGTDISANRRIRPRTRNGGFLYAFKTTQDRFQVPFRDPNAFVWQTFFNQTVFSSPVIADVLPGVRGDEVIIGSGCFFPQNSQNKRGRTISILRQRDGRVVQTLNTQACMPSSVAVGDIDNDGALEIVGTEIGLRGLGGPGQGRISAWNPEDPDPFWSTNPRVNGSNDNLIGDFKSPIIADVDGNGSLEVLATNGNGIVILAGSNGEQLTCPNRSCEDEENPRVRLVTGSTMRGTPAVADINNDGILDVIAGSSARVGTRVGAIYAWTNLDQSISSVLTDQQPFATPWAMYRGDSQHIAVFGE